MAKYRKKPVIIEAVQYNGDIHQPDLYALIESQDRTVTQEPEGYLIIETLEGKLRADIGDWILKGVKGELYPCKPHIFEKTYEGVE